MVWFLGAFREMTVGRWVLEVRIKPGREMSKEAIREITYYSLRHLWEKPEVVSVKILSYELGDENPK